MISERIRTVGQYATISNTHFAHSEFPVRAEEDVGESHAALAAYWMRDWNPPTSTTWTIQTSRGPAKSLAHEISDAYVRFAKAQVPLDRDIAAAVSEKLWDLYAR
jgi:hypothetical protein